MPDELLSPSGIPIEPVYHPADLDYARDLADPGVFPYTRGVQPTMYRGRLWTMRQYAGFGTAQQTNTRFRLLLEKGQTGLSVAFDLPTQMGIDSDSPRALGEVGRVGVAIDTVEDMHVLLDQIPLDTVSSSMTINATAATLLAMYVVVAEERGIPRAKLSGTIQNDILKEYIARGTYIYPPGPSLALIAEVFRFCAEEVPSWNPISISGYHIREAGATAVQELAFTFADAMEYVRGAIAAGLPVDGFATRLSFFFAAHNDLFEEVSKFRAARRLYARLMRTRFGANDASCRLRFHTQTGGVTLQAQQPLNNVVRVTIQALSAVLGGTQSLHTNGYDEALSLPTADAATLALRTQQIIGFESGAASTADPLAGSYYVEALTNQLEREAEALLERVDELGGAAKAIEAGFFQEEIARSAYEFQLRVERGETTIVGVNKFADDEKAPVIPSPDYSALEREQVARVQSVRAARDAGTVKKAFDALAQAAKDYGNEVSVRTPLMPLIIDAVRARAKRRRDQRRAGRRVGHIQATQVKPRQFTGALCLLIPMCASAQISDSLQGVFATGGWVAGSTPIMTANGSRTAVHNGPRADGGFQNARFAFGVGGRFWILKQTSEINGQGIDVYALGERRIGPGDRTTVRMTGGISHTAIDLYTNAGGLNTPPPNTVSETRAALSLGLGHEVPIVDIGLLLTGDVIVPLGQSSSAGRRGSVLEIGAGIRFHAYRAPPSRPGPSF